MRMLRTHGRTVLYGVILASSAILGSFLWFLETQTAPPTIAASSTPTSRPSTDEFLLSIPKIGVTAPVIEDVDGTDEKTYLSAIEQGVAQMRGTPLPTEDGTTFIFGHSSYYRQKPGDYKEVFKRLNELTNGDKFTLGLKGTIYTYEVFESKIVTDDDWSILSPADASPRTLTLMTCWPPGTLDRRYVVFARQIEQSHP